MTDRPSGNRRVISRTYRAYEQFREDIINGKLCPGQRLKIEELSRAYGVGSTPLREALSNLASEGLVTRADQRGFRVAAANVTEFEELLNIRCHVEERALRMSIARGGKDWEAEIIVACHRLAELSCPTEYDAEWERLHRVFHLSLVSSCGSALLLRLCGQFYDENSRYRHLARLENNLLRGIREEHNSVAEATLAGNAELAVERLMGHYRKTGDLLRTALAKQAGTTRGSM